MAELLDLDRLYYDGRHNAFTDLICWQDQYYVTFRTSEHHGLPPYGEILVFRSDDLYDWEECGTISTDGDDRDGGHDARHPRGDGVQLAGARPSRL